ncbi:MAG: M23 family metallopeptidase [Clostridia bacterium]|nr:M23 family metallopeptidase [Clostridia bacterium]
MVIHDREREQAWANAHAARKAEKERNSKPKSGLSVVGVQCLACVVILVLALLMRAVDGDVYQQLRGLFRQGLMGNELLTALALWWDDETPENITEADVKQNNFTDDESLGRATPDGASAVCLQVNCPLSPPLTEGTISSAYGYRTNPVSGREEFHRGVDIAAPEGTPLAAMYYGCVAEVGENTALGNYIRIRYGDQMEVLYAHCSAVFVEEGAYVRAGERVAAVGSSGNSTGPHVHVQVSAGGVVYNPGGVVFTERYA